MTTCVSCGANTESRAKYPYCAQCDTERTDPSIRPIVWEYVGGHRGSLPNHRGETSYTLDQLGSAYHSRKNGLDIFVRRSDRSPMGNIAVRLCNGIVIVNGIVELNCLLSDPMFVKNPSVENLPEEIDTTTPEHWDIVRRLQTPASDASDGGEGA